MNSVLKIFSENLAIFPIILPMGTAVMLLLIGDGVESLKIRRLISLASAFVGLLLAFYFFKNIESQPIMIYELGNWPAPFGINLVVDRLSALMLLLTWVIVPSVLWYASGGWDVHGRYFHAIFNFQLMGLSGAFLTGDLFNLFVFFEILLISSYVLMLHGQGRERLKAGFHYVVVNLVASSIFLIALALIYATAGTLNIIDLGVRVVALSYDQSTIFAVGIFLLLIVFGLKSAIAPLHLWLPNTYAHASAPVAALFSVMTKVGIYGIIRVHWVMLGENAGYLSMIAKPWLLPLGCITIVMGFIGALAAHRLVNLISYITISSIGMIVVAIGLFSNAGLSAALYYTVHSTLAIAALFLLVELVAAQRGDTGDYLRPANTLGQPVLLGLMILFSSASIAGIPPLPGFLGKLMVLQSSYASENFFIILTVILLSGFFVLIGLARAGSILFWNTVPSAMPTIGVGSSWRLLSATIILLLMSAGLVLFAAPMKRYTDAVAVQLGDTQLYRNTILHHKNIEDAENHPSQGSVKALD